jgi:hypothetical protein
MLRPVSPAPRVVPSARDAELVAEWSSASSLIWSRFMDGKISSAERDRALAPYREALDRSLR